jgi:glutathione reductase (NADPH)
VGLTEDEAKQQDLKYFVKFGDATQWSEFRRTGLKCAGYKLIIGEDEGKILGAHLLGRHMDEVVNIFAVAMRAGLTVRDLKSMVWSYPSIGYTIRYMLKNV